LENVGRKDLVLQLMVAMGYPQGVKKLTDKTKKRALIREIASFLSQSPPKPQVAAGGGGRSGGGSGGGSGGRRRQAP